MMKPLLTLLAGAGALAGAVQIAEPAGAGAPFIDPALINRNICGKSAAAPALSRAYFAKIGAAAASANDAPPPAFETVEGIGLAITTTQPEAQRLFNAALAHVWNFNHGEAIKALKAAQAQDPNCAMCYWLESFAWGPNINAPMTPDAAAPAWDALQKAIAVQDSASEKERALIGALRARYAKEAPADRAPLDNAFADAMDAVVAAYPDDDFIASLSAEANMDVEPWDYWMSDGRTPKSRAGKTMSMLEAVLARSPNYQPAIHLYIHMTEATANPYRAVEPAARLGALTPGLGHLIHMPSHTWSRIGRYKQSLRENISAVEADEAFLARPGDASPMYEFGYYVHNVHFVMTSAFMAGDRTTALAMAEKLDAKLPVDMAIAVPFAQPIKAAPYYVWGRFGEPDAVLALETPGAQAPMVEAAWRYARGEALARKGDAAGARAEAEAISKIIAEADVSALESNGIPAIDIMKIAQLTVAARAADADGDIASAIEAMEEAAALQDGLNYTEPPYWYYPAKQTLAAFVLKAGDVERAEILFLDSLAEIPNNGWAYAGLAQAYRAQRDKGAAKYANALFKRAWAGGKAPAQTEL